MKEIRNLLLSGLVLILMTAAQNSPGQLYQQAYLLEQGRGDLPGAIRIYQQIVRDFANDKRTAARALLRMGLCYERLGVQGAVQAYQMILNKFGEQVEVARIARQKLNALVRTGANVADLPTGLTLREVTLKDGAKIGSYATLSPDENQLLYFDWATWDLSIYDLPSGEIRRIYRVPLDIDPPWIYRWSPDGKKIALNLGSGPNYVAALMEVQKGEPKVICHRPNGSVIPLDWTPDSQFVLCGIQDDPRGLVLAGEGGQSAAEFQLEGNGFRVSPDARYIAFSAGTDSGEIQVIDISSPSSRTVVAPSPFQDADPLWSPDGRYLAFRSNRAESWDLWAIELKDGKPVGDPFLLKKDIGHGVSVDQWFRSGKLTFSKKGTLQDVWVLPVNPSDAEPTGKAFLISRVEGQNTYPIWSPDGKRILHTARRRSDQKRILHVTTLDGVVQAEIDLPYAFNNALWTPDGKGVVAAAYKDRENLFIEYNLDSAQTRTFLTHPAIASPFGHFSPDGARFLFDGSTATAGTQGIQVYDGASVRTIPGTEGARPARWSPDGRLIAFSRNNNLWVIGANGTLVGKLTEVGPQETAYSFAWSPDSRLIVYCRATAKGPWELWVASLDGKIHKKIEAVRGLNPWRVDWSPDGRYLALGTMKGADEFWVLENFWPGKE